VLLIWGAPPDEHNKVRRLRPNLIPGCNLTLTIYEFLLVSLFALSKVRLLEVTFSLYILSNLLRNGFQVQL